MGVPPLPLGMKGLESWILAVDLLAIVTQLQLWVRSEAVTGIDMTAEQVKVAREHCERVPSATRIQASSLLKAGVVPKCTTSTSVLTGNTAGNIERNKSRLLASTANGYPRLRISKHPVC